jgi:hypothetical protein
MSLRALDELEGDGFPRDLVGGRPDDAHPAFAEDAIQAVAIRDQRPRLQFEIHPLRTYTKRSSPINTRGTRAAQGPTKTLSPAACGLSCIGSSTRLEDPGGGDENVGGGDRGDCGGP